MINDAYSPDGLPNQSGLRQRNLYLVGRIPAYSMVGHRECIVVERHYVKEEGNRSQVTVMYTCRDLITSDMYYGCQRLDGMSGIMNGDDFILHPTEAPRPGSPTAELGLNHQIAQDADGDHVLVSFLEGSRSRPVIMGVLRHQQSKYGAKKADGERRLTTHQGTTVEIKKDGQYIITHKTGATVNIDNDGNIQVKPAAGKDVFIGDKDASENLVLGQAFKTMMDTVLNAIATHFHGSGVGPTTAPTNAVTFTQEAALLTNLLSDMAFTQKEQT